jgi:hypothetical protein
MPENYTTVTDSYIKGINNNTLHYVRPHILKEIFDILEFYKTLNGHKDLNKTLAWLILEHEKTHPSTINYNNKVLDQARPAEVITN